jgi:hypothetical protein
MMGGVLWLPASFNFLFLSIPNLHGNTGRFLSLSSGLKGHFHSEHPDFISTIASHLVAHPPRD